MKKLNFEITPEPDELWNDIKKNTKKLPQPELIPEAPLIIDEIKPSLNYNKAYHGDKLKNLTVGTTDDIDRRTAQKFTRGEFKIERRLDLHGYIEKEAYDKVFEFIKTSYLQNCRCVLIITGKGSLHREEDADIFANRGILKEQVPNWLNSDELRPLILSFSYSKPADGGEGALYILLRRNRR